MSTEDAAAGAGAAASPGSGADGHSFLVSHGKHKAEVKMSVSRTVGDLKRAIEEGLEGTGVDFKRCKVLGLPKTASDDTALSTLKLKNPHKIMLMGGKARVEATAEDIALREAVVDDFDVPDGVVVATVENPEYLELIEKRIKSYTPKKFNDFEPGKKCLVCDVDYTLMDHKSVVERPEQMRRPYLLEFFERVSPYYNIIIWSATNMKWIETKMQAMGVEGNPAFKIQCYMCYYAMIMVTTEKYGKFKTKPLQVVFGLFPEFCNPGNTIFLDDVGRNFVMCPQNGLKIKPARDMPNKAHEDDELVHLTDYLLLLKDLSTFEDLNHNKYRRYLAKHGK